MAGKGDKLRKGANMQAYWNNYDSIFKKSKVKKQIEKQEELFPELILNSIKNKQK